VPLPFKMKKTILSTLLFPALCHANVVTGVGEFYFGPDTSENTACEYAFQKSKQDVLQRAFGEEIESFTKENCVSETKCSIDVETYTQMFGKIKSIMNKDVKVYQDYGKKVCRVVIDSVVERIDNKTMFNVAGKFEYFENEETDFSFVSNTKGYVSIYKFHDDLYSKVYELPLNKINGEIKIKNESEKLKFKLPKNSFQSKELLVFLFSKEKPIDKTTLNYFEFTNMVNSLNSKFKKTIYRYVTISKKNEEIKKPSSKQVIIHSEAPVLTTGHISRSGN